MEREQDIKYPDDFEKLWKGIHDKRATRKESGYKIYLRTKNEYHKPDLCEQIKAKDKWIRELLDKTECQKCGTTEFLCGHNKRE